MPEREQSDDLAIADLAEVLRQRDEERIALIVVYENGLVDTVESRRYWFYLHVGSLMNQHPEVRSIEVHGHPGPGQPFALLLREERKPDMAE